MKRVFLFLKRKLIRISLRIKLWVGVKSTTFKLKTGEKLRIRNIDNLGFELLIGDQFENGTQNLIQNAVRKGMVVLDIGANIGYYTVKMANAVGSDGKIYAFEPNPSMVNELKENIRINNLNNVEVFPVALSNTQGTMPFFNPSDGNEAHGSLQPNNTFDPKNTIQVKVEKLDSILEHAGIKRVDFIKIDVEGAEFETLSGAAKLLSSDNKPIIIFESAENLVYAFGHKVFDVLRLVSDFGYEIENIDWGNWVARPKK